MPMALNLTTFGAVNLPDGRRVPPLDVCRYLPSNGTERTE